MPISCNIFFNWPSSRTIIDLRPTDAFQKGHFPGAISFPAIQFSSTALMLRELYGRGFTTPLHLLDQNGMIADAVEENDDMQFLEGGYKGYKIWMRDAFLTGPSIGVITGKTGSGKTELLEQLASAGRQVLHLEQMACHRGSVFGDMKLSQPLPEEFEYNLLKKWLSFDSSVPVWIEDKNAVLGKLFIPSALFQKMGNAVSFAIDQPFEFRLAHLLEEYVETDKLKFGAAIRKLEKRMGFSANHKALHYCNTCEMKKCLQLLLYYYDAAYEHLSAKKNKSAINVNPDFFQEKSTVLQLEKIVKEGLI